MTNIIFDLDGTLLDTEYQVSELTADIANEKGCSVSASSVFSNCAGYGSRDKFNWCAAQSGITLTEKDLLWMRTEHSRRKDALYDQPVIPVIEGIPDMLHNFYKSGIPMAVASSNTTARVRKGLQKTGLIQYFDHSYGTDIVENIKKPDPAVFNFTIGAMEISPDETVIVEDTVPGIIAAVASGSKAVAYLSHHFNADSAARKTHEFVQAGANEIIRNYKLLSGYIASL